jgi:hypothetical protein
MRMPKISKINGRRLKIFDWAMTGFIIAVIFMLFSSINTIRYVYVMQRDLGTWYEKDLLGQNSIQIARVNLLLLDRDLKVLQIGKNPDETRKSILNIKKHRNIFVQQMDIARPLFTSKTALEQLKLVYRLSKEYLNILDTIMQYQGGDRVHALSLHYGDISARFEEIDREMNKLDDLKQKKDLTTFHNIITQNEIMMGISFFILIASIIFRIFQFFAIKNK